MFKEASLVSKIPEHVFKSKKKESYILKHIFKLCVIVLTKKKKKTDPVIKLKLHKML